MAILGNLWQFWHKKGLKTDVFKPAGRGIRIRTLNDGVRAPQCFIQNANFKHVSRLSYLSNVSVNFVVLLNTKPNQIIQFYLLDILMLGWSIVLWFIFLVFFLIAIGC